MKYEGKEVFSPSSRKSSFSKKRLTKKSPTISTHQKKSDSKRKESRFSRNLSKALEMQNTIEDAMVNMHI